MPLWTSQPNMQTETPEQFLARGGQITRCPRAFAQDGHTPQSPQLTAIEAEALLKHYDYLEENYNKRWRRSPWRLFVVNQKHRTHLYTRLNNELSKVAITEEASNG